MEIMSKSDAIRCVLNEGLDSLKKHLQAVADVANGGHLTETDEEFLRAAEGFMQNPDFVEVARELQKEISWCNKRIKELTAKCNRLSTEISELQDELDSRESQ